MIKDDGSIVFNLGDKYQNGSLLLVPYRFATAVACKKLGRHLIGHDINPEYCDLARDRIANTPSETLYLFEGDE